MSAAHVVIVHSTAVELYRKAGGRERECRDRGRERETVQRERVRYTEREGEREGERERERERGREGGQREWDLYGERG